MQHRDYRVTVSMDEYVKARLPSTEVPKEYLSNTKEVSEGMHTNIKGVSGGLGWLASTRRPDMAATHSIIPSGYDRKSPQLISEVNAAVKQCNAFPITITIWPLPFAELRWTTFTDSSFDTGERQRHQQGWLVCATNKYFNQERTAPVSVFHWRSRKLTRKAGSPQLVETYAASSAVVEMTWIKPLWGVDDLERLCPSHAATIESTSQKPDATCDPQRKTQTTTIDALGNDLPQDDRKSALEVPNIEEFMRRATCRPRWCPYNQNAADAMTKFKGAHSERLFNVLRTGMYTLRAKKNELADRASQRQTGTVPRHEVSAIRAATARTFFVHTSPGMRGPLSGVPEGGAAQITVFVTPSFVLAHCVLSVDPLGLRALERHIH